MTENVAGACLSSIPRELNLRHNVQFYRFDRFSVFFYVYGTAELKVVTFRSYGSKKVPYKLGYKLSAPFLNYHWLMVALSTIDQS